MNNDSDAEGGREGDGDVERLVLFPLSLLIDHRDGLTGTADDTDMECMGSKSGDYRWAELSV